MVKKNNIGNLFIGLLILFIIVLLFHLFGNKNSTDNINTNNDYIIEYYSMKGCTHCSHFEKEWKKIIKKFPYNYEKFDESNSKFDNNIEIFNINGFPHIQLTKKGALISEYKGLRNFNDIINWYKNNINNNK